MDITRIVQLAIELIAAAVMTFLIPWLKEKCDAEKLQRAATLVRYAVMAAEQLYGGGNGSQKKEYVLTWLESRGMRIDLDTIDRMIEASVLELSAEIAPHQEEDA